MTVKTKKPSKTSEYSKYFDQLKQITCNIYRILTSIHKEFEILTPEELYGISIDASIVSQSSFNINCSSNKRMAYVGDALLTLRIAELEYSRGNSGKGYQIVREHYSSKDTLSAFHDHWFGNTETLLLITSVGSNVNASAEKRAEFIEALIGMLHLFGHDKLANFVCKSIGDYYDGLHRSVYHQ